MKKNKKRPKAITAVIGHRGTGKTSHPKIKNQLHIDMEETFSKCLATSVRKNADYAGTGPNADPYKNFRGSEFVGVDPARAILVRMMDKMSRVSNLLSQEAQVKDEGISDTLEDLVNYAAILKSFIKNNPKACSAPIK